MDEVKALTADEILVERLERDEFDSAAAGGFAVVGAILKAQGAVIRDVNAGRNLRTHLRGFFAAALVFSAVYGAIMGLFQPGLQTLYAALKVPVVVLGTALLCTPTFYVFNSILGSRLTLAQSAAVVLLFAASATLILVAFAPIAWLFTMTTGGPAFLRIMHLLVFTIAIAFGAHVLRVTRKYLLHLDLSRTAIHAGFARLWFWIVLFVAFQMAYYFRPLVTPGPFHSGERGLFVEALGWFFRGGA
ncbi:MAG: hypothetical protein HYY17_00375 [Planctomycetes bacterium]|nr:hypothetical protein [Planctomycetota bacterium]